MLQDAELAHYTAIICGGFCSRNPMAAAEIPQLIDIVKTSLRNLADPPKPIPAHPIDQSVNDEFLVCLEDGKKLQTLRRYLKAQYGMTPEEYRAKWGLPDDYPMTAPAYQRKRSDLAKQAGLGRRR